MEIISLLTDGLGAALVPINLLMLLTGIGVGMVVGLIPGLSAANGIALMLPVSHTFALSPQSALILYAGVYYGTKYTSRVSAILRNLPGDVSSRATSFDGYPLALGGGAGKALTLTAFSSFVGSCAALVLLTFVFGVMPDIGGMFGPPEYVALLALAFILIVVLSSADLPRTLSSLFIGLMMSVVGLDWGTGVFRFSANIPELYDGIDFIIVVIGVFALSEVFLMMEMDHWGKQVLPVGPSPHTSFVEVWRLKWACLRATAVGLIIGILPGAGPYVANLTAYRLEKRLQEKQSPNPVFGRGNLSGVIAPEAANSSCALAAFIPLLALGIPGSATTAVLLGALLQMNVDPGTGFIAVHREMVWALVGSMFFGNILLLALNLLLVRIFPFLLRVPGWVVMPVIVIVSFISVYTVKQSLVALTLMVAIGIFAYLLRKFRYPLAPLILGYVLGKPFEDNLRMSLSFSGGDYEALISSELAIVLWSCAVLAIILKSIVSWQKFSRERLGK